MTTLIIESTLIGLAARPLGEWKRGPLLRVAEAAMSGDLLEEGGAIFSRYAAGAAKHLRAEGRTIIIFGPEPERGMLDLAASWGFTVHECTAPALIDRTPLALTSPWLATVATRGRLPHALRRQVITAAQLALTTGHAARALRLHSVKAQPPTP